MSAATDALLSGLLGSLIGGALSLAGAIGAVKAVQRDIGKDERRRLKLVCVVALSGLRHVLSAPSQAAQEGISAIQIELNRALVLWADDPAVLGLLREVRGGAVASVVQLIREMAKSTTLDPTHVANDDLESVLQISRSAISGPRS